MYRRIYESKGILYNLLDWIFPENLNCIFCDMPISRKNKYSICKYCFDELVFIKTSCATCGKPSINKSVETDERKKEVDPLKCDFCRDRHFLFDRNISFVEYGDLSSKFVFGLKYNLKTYLSKIISKIMYDMITAIHSEVINDIDYVLYVPLNKNRFKERGFNQSEKIAYYFSMDRKITLLDAIERNKDTKKLYNLNKDERYKELKKAFNIKEEYKSRLEGSNIILIDDIFTTGSTVNEISKELKLIGVNKIIVLSFLTGKYN